MTLFHGGHSDIRTFEHSSWDALCSLEGPWHFMEGPVNIQIICFWVNIQNIPKSEHFAQCKTLTRKCESAKNHCFLIFQSINVWGNFLQMGRIIFGNHHLFIPFHRFFSAFGHDKRQKWLHLLGWRACPLIHTKSKPGQTKIKNKFAQTKAKLVYKLQY